MTGAEPAFPELHVYHWRGSEKSDAGKLYETDNVLPRWHGGLTKREYFAAIVMQGLVASGSIRQTEVVAVQMADALIAELSK